MPTMPIRNVPKSPLPKDTAYWEELARRIREDASGPLAAYASRARWYGVLAGPAPWLIAASAAAILFLWLALPAADSSATLRRMERSLSPDEAAGALVGGPEPPTVDALLVQFSPPEGAEPR
ncbi:MAG TPA: hypothetical protein VEK15_23180 [Vicinamibacteria bacterium]|nr:hypothetical protein [Vicinamibacteria bacterium]